MGNDQGKLVSQNELDKMNSMPANLRRKYKSGVQFNMKVIIKGDSNVGKSCLWRRLQGGKFLEEYTPTPEIQVANIHWNYKVTDDIVKVEVWDIVDKAKGGDASQDKGGLKVGVIGGANLSDPRQYALAEKKGKGQHVVGQLDAETIDVYKGTHAVILMMDVTKQWTFGYVKREMDKIPRGIEILILGNRVDSPTREVTSLEVNRWVESLKSSRVRYYEASMKNCFGLAATYTFFNIPFLRLQRSSLQKQLETNAEELQKAIDELQLMDNEDYETFTKRKEEVAKAKARIESEGVAGQKPPSQRAQAPAPRSTTTAIASPAAPAASAAAASSPATSTPKRGWFSRMADKVTGKNTPGASDDGAAASPLDLAAASSAAAQRPAAQGPEERIEDFTPGELDAGFFDDDDDDDDVAAPKSAAAPTAGASDGSNDDDDDGPLVADPDADESSSDGGNPLLMAEEDLSGSENEVAEIAVNQTRFDASSDEAPARAAVDDEDGRAAVIAGDVDFDDHGGGARAPAEPSREPRRRLDSEESSGPNPLVAGDEDPSSEDLKVDIAAPGEDDAELEFGEMEFSEHSDEAVITPTGGLNRPTPGGSPVGGSSAVTSSSRPVVQPVESDDEDDMTIKEIEAKRARAEAAAAATPERSRSRRDGDRSRGSSRRDDRDGASRRSSRRDGEERSSKRRGERGERGGDDRRDRGGERDSKRGSSRRHGGDSKSRRSGRRDRSENADGGDKEKKGLEKAQLDDFYAD